MSLEGIETTLFVFVLPIVLHVVMSLEGIETGFGVGSEIHLRAVVMSLEGIETGKFLLPLCKP